MKSDFLAGQHLIVLTGDCRAVLKQIPDASINCVVTSPPYWGLRDYGHADQIGQEPTIEGYIESMRELFRELWRVVRDDGSAWLNIGDSYNAYNGNRGPCSGHNKNYHEALMKVPTGYGLMAKNLKPKDLCMIPLRVAVALQSDGWYLRSEIIWHKIAPMPESVKDRPTRAHEMVYLLTKSERYFYNAAEARDPLKTSSVTRLGQDVEAQEGSVRANGGAKTNGKMKAVAPACFGGSRKSETKDQTRLASGSEWKQDPQAGANWRDVWSIGHEGYDGGHFAVMPLALAKRCIVAGCPSGGIVLDPFAGSGTTGLAAMQLGRRAMLIELNPEYVHLCSERCRTTPGLPL